MLYLGTFFIIIIIPLKKLASRLLHVAFRHVTHTFFSLPPLSLIPLIGFRRRKFVPSSKDSSIPSDMFSRRSHFNVGMSTHNEILTSESEF